MTWSCVLQLQQQAIPPNIFNIDTKNYRQGTTEHRAGSYGSVMMKRGKYLTGYQ